MRRAKGRNDVYEAVVGWIAVRGFSPTYRDIAWVLGISVSTVHVHVHRLIDEGLLTQDGSLSRTLRPL